MNSKIQVLDHGFVRIVEAWGHGDAGNQENCVHQPTIDHECGIIEAARQSTQGSFHGWEQDEKLLKYLYENRHATPFEFAGMVLEIQAPIFVFREWMRHRVQSFNEMSARYAPLPDLNYVPTVERLMRNSTTNKQAGTIKGADELDEKGARIFQSLIEDQYERAESTYQSALTAGVPKELARIVLPVGRYSKMRASTCLRNWLGFCTLRSSPFAQEEIRLYSEAVETILKDVFPRTYTLFVAQRNK